MLAHGIILYVYPRNTAIDKNYTGCQSQWFYDNDHFRKLNIIHYQNSKLVAYDKLTIDGEIAYQCRYKNRLRVAGDEGRCPTFEKLDRASYRSGCYSLSYLNESDSYNLAFKDCVLE